VAVVLMLVLVPQLSEQLLARPLPPPEAADRGPTERPGLLISPGGDVGLCYTFDQAYRESSL